MGKELKIRFNKEKSIEKILDLKRNIVISFVDTVLSIGEELSIAKEKMPHGEWLPYLRETKTNEMTAWRYMEIYKKIIPNLTHVLDLKKKEKAEGISFRGIMKHLEIGMYKPNKYAEELKKLSKQYKKEEGIEIIHGDFIDECKDIEYNSIDCIITDPPYPEEYLDLWSELSRIAKDVLKPGGYCITYSGHIHLDEVIKRLSEHLEYYWQIVLLHTGHKQAVHPRMVYANYKPILIFFKPPMIKPLQYFDDVIEGSGTDKKLHEWQQSENELIPIIETFTKPNDIVLDPMAGSGTTVIACYKLKRRIIAIDKEKENIKIIRGRKENVI